MLFSKELFNGIINLEGREAIIAVFHRHGDSLDIIKGPKWTVMDIDTPKDFLEAIRYLEKR